MKVLVLNGSPRDKGNTAALVNTFVQEAEQLGHSVNVVNIGKKNIRGCLNCNACRRTLKGQCVQQDDMQDIYPLMAECEVLVIASPVYYYSLTGQMHCAIQRCYAFERLPKLKKAALIMTAAVCGFDSGICTYRDAILGHMGAKNLGIVTSAASQIHSPSIQAEVRQLARNI